MLFKVAIVLIISSTTILAVQELHMIHVVYMHYPVTPVIRLDDSIINSSESLRSILDNEETLDMTNNAKLTMYNLGVYLRKKYGELLGDIYMPSLSKTITADNHFSKISALLVNAGLWPPVGIQRWKDDLDWQPVSISYEQKWNDTLMLGRLCPNYIAEKTRVDEIGEAKDVAEQFSQLFNFLRQQTNFKVETVSDVADLYRILRTNVERNVTLPDWSDDIFPYGKMHVAMIMNYRLLGATNLQRQLNGGVLLKKIIADTVAYISGENNSTKIYQYSGDDVNLTGLLQAMKMLMPYVPRQGTAIIFEVYRNTETNVYSIKLDSYCADIEQQDFNSVPSVPDIFYEVTEFLQLRDIYDSIPFDEQNLCGWDVNGDYNEMPSDEVKENLSSLLNSNFYFVLTIVGFHIVHSYNKP